MKEKLMEYILRDECINTDSKVKFMKCLFDIKNEESFDELLRYFRMNEDLSYIKYLFECRNDMIDDYSTL